MNGALKINTRQVVEGSRSQHAYCDTWTESIDFVFDGQVTNEVCDRIVKAMHSAKVLRPAQSSRGALRYRDADKVASIDVANKKVLISCVENILD